MGEYLAKSGHRLFSFTSNCQSTDDFTHSYHPLSNNGLPVYTIFHRPLKKILPLFAKGPIFKLIPFIRSFIKIIFFRPDFIIAGPLPTTVILYAYIFKKITRAKLIVNASFHSDDPDFHRHPLIYCLKHADLIWTLSRYETDYFHRQFHIPRNRLLNLGNGIDPQFLTPAATRHSDYLLYLGSFSAHKDIPTLITAFHYLSTDYKLVLAGKSSLYLPRINKLIQTLPSSISSRIKLITDFSDKHLSHLIDHCLCLILPSTQESFGLVLIEAMARRKPVIAADIPSSKELISKSKSGLIFRQKDHQHLASQINFLVHHPNNYGQNGYNYVRQHLTWNKLSRRLWQKISLL